MDRIAKATAATVRGLIALGFVGGLLVAFIMLAVLMATAASADDPEAEPTVLQWCTGDPLRGGCLNPWIEATVPQWEDGDKPTIINLTGNEDYTWVKYKSGPNACVFSWDGKATEYHDGREMQENSGHPWAYFKSGWGYVAALSGRACSGFGINSCTGQCW